MTSRFTNSNQILIAILCQLCSQVIQIWQRMAALNFSYINRKEKTEDKSSNALAWRARAVLINKRIFSVITALPSLLQCLLRLSQTNKECHCHLLLGLMHWLEIEGLGGFAGRHTPFSLSHTHTQRHVFSNSFSLVRDMPWSSHRL